MLYNRVPLPPKEVKRIESHQSRILEALRQGTRTNDFLSTISLDYTRCIRALRMRGHNIRGKLIKEGLWTYTLLPSKDPKWRVTGKVTLADGGVSTHTIFVEAIDAATARNRAQHKFTKVKIVACEAAPPNIKPPTSSFFGQPRRK